jgi:hypothetical protein
MSKKKHYICKNLKGNCPHAIKCEVIVIGGVEKWECPLGINHFNPDDGLLERVKVQWPGWPIVKRVAFFAVPVICMLLVGLHFILKPPPPFAIDVIYTNPPSAEIHPGESISWTFSIKGRKDSDKPEISFDSLSPSLLSKADMKLETKDALSRKYILTAQPLGGQKGQARVTLSVGLGSKSDATNGFAFKVVPLGPPTLVPPTPMPLLLESGHDSLVLPFTIFDEKIDSEKLIFSTTVDPADRVASTVQTSGTSRTVTLSRNKGQSGPVQLAIRVVAPDGRETNQSYGINIEAAPIPFVQRPPQQPPTPPPATCDDQMREAQRLLARGQKEAALARIEGVLTACPPSGKAWRIKGSVLYSLSRFAEAIECCEKSLAINPREGEAWFVKGASYESQSQFREAAGCYGQWLSLTPNPDPRKATVEGNIKNWHDQGIQ